MQGIIDEYSAHRKKNVLGGELVPCCAKNCFSETDIVVLIFLIWVNTLFIALMSQEFIFTKQREMIYRRLALNFLSRQSW